MKTTLIAAGLALALMGGTAEAQSFRGEFGSGYRGGVRVEMALRDRDFGRDWGRGDRFYGRRMVVTDWRRHGLHRPSFGTHWVRSGNRFLLIGNRSGRVVDVVFAGRLGYGY